VISPRGTLKYILLAVSVSLKGGIVLERLVLYILHLKDYAILKQVMSEFSDQTWSFIRHGKDYAVGKGLD
jgi:hypothetical protein